MAKAKNLSITQQSRAYTYAKWCTEPDNHKVGVDVKQQARLWIDIADGKNTEAFVDDIELRNVRLLLGLMIHPDIHKPMPEALEDYAIFFIVALFCTKSTDTKRRYYQTGLLLIARKNYKTFTSAVIFILALLLAPEFARMFSVAPDYKLSSELKLAVAKILKSSPALMKHFVITRTEIRCVLRNTDYTPLAYSNDKLDGKTAFCWLADEAGAMNNYPVEAMRSSQINMRQKLGIIISTEYPNDFNALTDEVDIATKQLYGLLKTKNHYFSLLYRPDAEIQNNWETDDNCIFQANPVSVNSPDFFDALASQRAIAALYENARENFLCKHLNIQYAGIGTEGYVDVQHVQACKRAISPKYWKGRRVYLGLDLSQTEDNTAVAMITYDKRLGLYVADVLGFIPKDAIVRKTKKEKVDYAAMVAAGCCISCGDEVIDYSAVEEYILTLAKKKGVIIEGVGYDRYNAISTVQKLEAAGIPCVELKQHSSVLHPATKLLKECILQRRFAYSENRLLEINFQNARCSEDTNLNKYVNKKRSAGKVDMVVALINALCLLIEEQQGSSDFGAQW